MFQNSRCALSGAPLELPAVHFLCGHSFNARALGEGERECPLCAPQFRTILDIRRSLRAGAAEQARACCLFRLNELGFRDMSCLCISQASCFKLRLAQGLAL